MRIIPTTRDDSDGMFGSHFWSFCPSPGNRRVSVDNEKDYRKEEFLREEIADADRVFFSADATHRELGEGVRFCD